MSFPRSAAYAAASAALVLALAGGCAKSDQSTTAPSGSPASLRAVGLLVTGFVAVAALFGHDDARNPTAGFVYVLFWVGLVPLSLLFGPVWRLLNPLRTVHAAMA